MSRYQSKGDRSDAQLRKAGRASDTGLGKPGVFSPIALKGGGPSPSGSVLRVAAVLPQPALTVTPVPRISASAAATNRGGKRANGHIAPARGASGGESSELGGQNRLQPASPKYHINQQQRAPVAGEGMGTTDVPQYLQMESTPQFSHLKGTIQGGIVKACSISAEPGASVAEQSSTSKQYLPSSVAAIPEQSYSSAASPEVSQSVQFPFSFQFGSFDSTFESSITAQSPSTLYPLRTNSAPPNLDEQKREQARFVRASSQTLALAHGMHQKSQLGSRNMGSPTEQISPVILQPILASGSCQVSVAATSTAPAPSQQQRSQSQYAQQHQQASNVHMPIPHVLQLSHMQQQQAMAQQQGMVQQSLTQTLKFPQSLMATPPHGPQLLGTSIGSQLANQIPAQKMPPQIAHQLGPNMGGGMGGQLSPSIQGSQFGLPISNHFIPQRVSRAIKIVDPNTHEELRFDTLKRGDLSVDSGLSTSGLGTAGLAVRVPTNNGPQRAVGYSPPLPHQMAPGNMAFFGHPYVHPPPSFYQAGQSKACVLAGGLPSNSPTLRLSYPGAPPAQCPRFVGHTGAASIQSAPKLGSQPGPISQLGSAAPGPNPSENLSNPNLGPIMVTPVTGPPLPTVPGTPAVILNARPIPEIIASERRSVDLVVPPCPSASSTPSLLSPSPDLVTAFKFGDVDSLGTLAFVGKDNDEGLSVVWNGSNGHALTGSGNTCILSPANVGVVASTNPSMDSVPVSHCKPTGTVVPPKQVTGSPAAMACGLKVGTSIGTGGAGMLGEKVKVESTKCSGNQNSRKNIKKDRFRQQQQFQLATTTEVLEVLGGKSSDDHIPSGRLTLLERSPTSGPSITTASPIVYTPEMSKGESGGHSACAVCIPDELGEAKQGRGEARKISTNDCVQDAVSGSETLHYEDRIQTSFKNQETECFTTDDFANVDEELLSESETPSDQDAALSVPIVSTSYNAHPAISASCIPTDMAAEVQSSENDDLLGSNVLPGGKLSTYCAADALLTFALTEVELMPIFDEVVQNTSENLGIQVQEEERMTDSDASWNKKEKDIKVHSIVKEVGNSAQGEDASDFPLKFEPSAQDSELQENRAAHQDTLMSAQIHEDLSNVRQLSLTAPPSVHDGTTSGASSAALHLFSKMSSCEKSSSQYAVLQETSSADNQVISFEAANGLIVGADLDIPVRREEVASTIMNPSALHNCRMTPRVVGKAAETAVRSLDLSQIDSVTCISEESRSESDGLSQSKDASSVTLSVVEQPLLNEKNISGPYKDAAMVEKPLSEAEGDKDYGSILESTLLSNFLCSSTTDRSEAANISEAGIEASEPTFWGSTNLGNDGLKGGSKRKKKKELLARADAAGNTADLYNAYKVPEEKKLEDVKQSDVFDGGPLVSNLNDCAAVLVKSIPKEVDDWEEAAEVSTPKSPVGHLIDSCNKKYTRDFLMTFKASNQDFPSNFEIRHDIIGELLLNPSLTYSLLADTTACSGRIVDRQPGTVGQRPERRVSGIQQGPNDDRWTRQHGVAAPAGRNQPGDARMDLSMAGVFRQGQGNIQPGLITQLPSPLWPGMATPQPGFTGLIPRGAAGTMIPHFMMPGAPRGVLNGVDGDRWHRQPLPGSGLIPSPRTPLPAIHKAENRYEVGKVSDEESAKQRLIKGILNKLTPQNFEKLFAQVQEANIDSAMTLTGVIAQIFDKALMEPTFCEMYAQFCVKLAGDLPEFTENNEKITFKRVLLNKCQEEFECGEREQEEAEKIENVGEVQRTPEQREEKRLKARRRMLGNIRFIGELYKKSMLTERIMHECIKKLLGEFLNPDEEDIEALCKLMSTIGRIIDHLKAKEHIDAYFRRMEGLSSNMKLSSRLRFMLKDVIDLRQNGWQERRKIEGPKKIDEVHRDAVQERHQATRGDRRGPSMGAGPARGKFGASPDFGMRVSQSPLFSSIQMGSGPSMGGIRNSPSLQAGLRGGVPTFVQDVRVEDRILLTDVRPVPMPLSQRIVDEVPINLGPQGNLGRGMAIRQPLGVGRSGLSDSACIMGTDMHRSGGGPNLTFNGPERHSSCLLEDIPSWSFSVDRTSATVRQNPSLEKPMGDRLGSAVVTGELRIAPEQQGDDKIKVPNLSPSNFQPPRSALVASPLTGGAVPFSLSDDQVKKKFQSIIKEYYSIKDLKEAALCVEELNASTYHTVMVSSWVLDSLEKNGKERELLLKLLLHLHKLEPVLLSLDELLRGMEIVLSQLVDTVVDVPKAPEYLGGLLGNLVLAGVVSLAQVNNLLKDGGAESGELMKKGFALEILGSVLDILRKEKGEKHVINVYKSSGLHVENLVSPDEKNQVSKLETFLGRRNLQYLLPMIPLERHVNEALDRKEPILDLVRWIEKNVSQSTTSDPSFLRMIMSQVLRRIVPQPVPSDFSALEVQTKNFAPLLRSFATGSARAAEAHQIQYIVAIQLFADEHGHPLGMMSKLFDNLYHDEVISEAAFTKWKDDIKDSTPGRDKAIREVGKWLAWLETAPEEGGEEE